MKVGAWASGLGDEHVSRQENALLAPAMAALTADLRRQRNTGDFKEQLGIDTPKWHVAVTGHCNKDKGHVAQKCI